MLYKIIVLNFGSNHETKALQCSLYKGREMVLRDVGGVGRDPTHSERWG